MKNLPNIAGLIAIGLALSWFVQAGSLEPPGPPAPTMKTLDEVEPRVPIRAVDLPLTITQSGSYYFTGNIVTAGAGIVIDTDDVTIDLMGFKFQGGTGIGIGTDLITMPLTKPKNITIKNGSITGWSEEGVHLGLATNVIVKNIRASGNTEDGIRVGSGSLIKECVAEGNGRDGINALDSSSVLDSVARMNGIVGIRAHYRCTVSNCTASENITGILVDEDTTVVESTASSNTLYGITTSLGGHVINCTASDNGEQGIRAVSGYARIEGCSVSRNGEYGISVTANCLIIGNNLYFNGRGVSGGAAIFAEFGDNRIDGNHMTRNDIGIDVDGLDNLVVRNTAIYNTGLDYDIAAGNEVGTIVSTIAGAGPWDNFEN